MTIAEIIEAARQYTQIAGSTWFAPSDELRSVNRAYRDIYEKILDSNDEYFIKEITVPLASMVNVRDHLWEYTLPDDWHRLRKLSAIIPNGERQLDRFDPQDIQRNEGYRYFQNKLRIQFYDNFTEFRLEYYPSPVEYTSTASDVIYPPQLEPLIISYQLAMDIAKSSGGDPAKHAEEYARLWQRFEHATARRDNFRYPKIANVYRSTTQGW